MKYLHWLLILVVSFVVINDVIFVLLPMLQGEYVHPQLKQHLFTTPIMVALVWSITRSKKPVIQR